MNDPYGFNLLILLQCLFDGDCASDGHTDHGVVTCADETHHLNASVALAELRGEKLPPKSLAV